MVSYSTLQKPVKCRVAGPDELVFDQNNYRFCFYVFGFVWQAGFRNPDSYREQRMGPADVQPSAVEWARLR